MKKINLIICAFCLLSSISYADNTEYYSDGKKIGKQIRADNFNGITESSAESSIPMYSESKKSPQSSSFSGGQGDPINAAWSQITGCSTNVNSKDKREAAACDATNFIYNNAANRPQWDLKKSDISNTRKAFSNPSTYLPQNLGVTTTNICVKESSTTNPTYTRESCDEYNITSNQYCVEGRIIEVASNHTYQCQDQRETVYSSNCILGQTVIVDADTNFQCQITTNAYENNNCHRKAVVSCSGSSDGCDQGGIIPNSIIGSNAGGYSFASDGSGNYLLEMGRKGDNYWKGHAVAYDRSLTFDVKDKDLLTKFTLTHAWYDDYIWIMINGTTLYIGPYGGSYIQPEIKENCAVDPDSGRTVCSKSYNVRFCDADKGCVKPAELNTSRNITLAIDALPYIQNGSNEIWVRTIVDDMGEGAVQFSTRQKCPANCTIGVNNECSLYEERAR